MGQLFLMFVLALSPIICLIIALIALKQQAWPASRRSPWRWWCLWLSGT